MDEEIWEVLVRALRALNGDGPDDDKRINRAEDWVQSQYGEWED